MSDVLTPARPEVRQPEPDVSGPGRPVRPGRRPRSGSPGPPPKHPVRPASPASPARSASPARPLRTGVRDRPVAGAGQVSPVRRTSFVLLLLGLLGGGLVCLLVVNTTLAANSFQIISLQKANAAASEQVQELQQQVAAARSASMIEKEAKRLGMRPDPELIFINLRTRQIQAPRGAAAAALAARLADGWPTATGGQPGTRQAKRSAKKTRAVAPARGSQ